MEQQTKTAGKTAQQINKSCKCCKAYIRAFNKYSLTDDKLNFYCGSCGSKVFLRAIEKDNKYIIEIEVIK